MSQELGQHYPKGRFTHSMPFPCHAVPPSVQNVSFPFDLHSTYVSDSHLPWHGMAGVNQTRLHCVNQMGKTHSKSLEARHGRGTTWARHGNGMLCVNRP